MRTYPTYSERLADVDLPQELDFDRREYERRLARLREAMEERGLDILLVSDLASICYLSGFQTPSSGTFATLFVAAADIAPVLQIIDHEYGSARYMGWVEDIRTFAWYLPEEGERQQLEIIAGLGRTKRPRIALERAAPIPLHRLRERARQAGISAEWEDASGLLNQVRRVKSPAEIEAMRESGRIADAALSATIADMRPGMTDNDVAARLHAHMIAEGSEFVNMGPFVATGLRSSLAHSTWKRHPIAPGDPIFLEVGCPYKRYNAPMMRSAVMGATRPEFRELAAAASETLAILLATIRAGLSGHDIAVAAGRGFAPVLDRVYFQGAFGYTVGLGAPPDWAEGSFPFIAEGVEEELVAGMTFHLPVAARIAGLGGMAVSETVLVTEDGCEVLTGRDRSFPEIAV